jgi:hypothetical protein
VSSLLTDLTKNIGDAFNNVSPILAATGVIKANNSVAQQPSVSKPATTSGVSTNMLLILGVGGFVTILLVVMIARKS